MTREAILERFRRKVAEGRPIIGGGAGTGLSAKCAEAGGIDLIIIYNSGRFRMAGRGSLSGMMPYGDANQIVMDMAREVLPVARKTPVLAGVCGTDPFRIMKLFLRDIQTAGFSGVQNFPTVGLIDGTFTALDAMTGEVQWRFATLGPGGHSVAIVGDTAYIQGGDQYLYALDRDTGEVRWRFEQDCQFIRSRFMFVDSAGQVAQIAQDLVGQSRGAVE